MASETEEPALPARGIVVVFAKAPILGTVKTRLAATIGEPAALAFYLRLLGRTVERLSGEYLSGKNWRLRLAVTPDDSVGDGALWPADTDRFGQGGGDLGERMLRVLRLARPERPIVIVGCDIPGLDARHATAAFAALAANDLVFGPADDGGFYLVGAARPPKPELFDGVRWSSAATLADVTSGLDTPPALVETLRDLDDIASLEAHRAAGRL